MPKNKILKENLNSLPRNEHNLRIYSLNLQERVNFQFERITQFELSSINRSKRFSETGLKIRK